MLEYIETHIWSIALLLNYILAIIVIIVILLKNIDPSKTLAYILVMTFFPFIGLIVYYLFGQEYRKTKIFNRKDIANSQIVKRVSDNLFVKKQDLYNLSKQLDDKIKLVKLLKTSDKSPLTFNNDIEILKNGEAKFDRLIQDIKEAKQYIHLEYYILKDDTIGIQIINLLCEKSNAGVEVKLIYDDVGSNLSSSTKRQLDASGVEHYPFMPVVFNSLTGKSNYRNHRKIAIIDGKIGFVGGINISDEYTNKINSKYWRDTHLRIYGEAVKVLQFHFLTSWDFVSKGDLKINPNYFPEVDSTNNVAVQIAASGPDTQWANIMIAIMTAINNAEEYVYITTPYFIPNDEIITSLQIAAKVGVDVKLIIPKESDSWIAKYATNSHIELLLEAGVKVYRYNKGFIHSKTIVVDDVFSTIGTCNLDNRSFEINFEVNALIYNKEQSLILKSHFTEDINHSDCIDSDLWKTRSKIKRLKESFARLWSPLL